MTRPHTRAHARFTGPASEFDSPQQRKPEQKTSYFFSQARSPSLSWTTSAKCAGLQLTLPVRSSRYARSVGWFGHGCSGHRMLLEHERGLGIDVLVVCMDTQVTVCSWNTNVTMVWAWMLWSPYALGTRTLLWFGHGCSCHHMLLEHERCYGLGMDALVTVCSWNTNVTMVWAWMLWSPYALGTRTLLWFGHGCSGHRMLLEHERYYGLAMGALVTVCSWNTNVTMVWAWMLWSPYALGTRTLLWFGHGCSGHRMLFFQRVLSSALCRAASSAAKVVANPVPWPTPRGLSPPSESTNLRTPWQNKGTSTLGASLRLPAKLQSGSRLKLRVYSALEGITVLLTAGIPWSA